MEIFRAQLSRYIPHPHRDSWMRNKLDTWLNLLRFTSFLTLLAAAWSILQTSSPLGVPDQFQPYLEQITGKFLQEVISITITPQRLQNYLQFSIAGFFGLAGLCCAGCGRVKNRVYILPVFGAGVLLIIAALKHYSDSDFKIISIARFLLPIATPFLLIGYQRLANKLDHWNYAANFFCVITVFGNALTYLFYPKEFPHFPDAVFPWIGLPVEYGAMVLSLFSCIAIFFALFTALAITRRVGLFALIVIGLLSSIYRILTQLLDTTASNNHDLIIADFFFYMSYWFVPILILLSLASRRKTQTLRL